MNPVSNRKKKCAKGLRDEMFNIIARLEIAELVKALLPSFTKGGLELGDVYTFLSDRTGRRGHLCRRGPLGPGKTGGLAARSSPQSDGAGGETLAPWLPAVAATVGTDPPYHP